MRFTASEKQEIIHMVTKSDLGVNRTLLEIGLNKSTFYNWYKVYSDHVCRQTNLNFSLERVFINSKLS